MCEKGASPARAASHGPIVYDYLKHIKMDKITPVAAILEGEGFHPIIEKKRIGNTSWNEIIWTDTNGDECSIFEDNIAIEHSSVSWFQSSKRDKHLLKIYEKGDPFSWIPITYNPAFGCTCFLLEWYKNHLLFIYQEKHDIYICSILGKTVKHVNFHGEEMARQGDIISFDTFMGRLPNKIRLIKVPELILLEPMDKSEAERTGLLPMDLNRPGKFLSGK